MNEGRGVYDETMAKATQINTNENVKAYYAGEYKGKTVEELSASGEYSIHFCY